MQFCAVTAALVVGATAERGRVVPAMVFTFFWATLVYCPVAYWAWGANGWGFKYGVLDYAGGGPVEIGSGVSALAYSWVLGRRNEKMMLNFRPHNISLITLGTILLWFGWLGFNGGSAFGANLRATMACWNSCLTAMFAAMTWCLLDFRLARKWSLVGWCSGTISGLVAATPASGVITPWASILLGVVAGVACNFGTKIKFMIGIDDALDVFAEHAIGGIVGLLFNAFFAADYIIGLDGVNMGAAGGFLNHNYRQMYVQVAYIVAACAYTFVVSAIIAKAIDMIPGLHLRASSEAELLGMDDDQHGEFAYDYVEVRSTLSPSTDQHNTNIASPTGPPRLPRLDARREGPQAGRRRRHPAARHRGPPGPRRQRVAPRARQLREGREQRARHAAARAGGRPRVRGGEQAAVVGYAIIYLFIRNAWVCLGLVFCWLVERSLLGSGPSGIWEYGMGCWDPFCCFSWSVICMGKRASCGSGRGGSKTARCHPCRLPPAGRLVARATGREAFFLPCCVWSRVVCYSSCWLYLLLPYRCIIPPWLLPPSSGGEFEVGYPIFLRTVGEDGD